MLQIWMKLMVCMLTMMMLMTALMIKHMNDHVDIVDDNDHKNDTYTEIGAVLGAGAVCGV